MDDRATQKIQAQLSPGEALLWAGRPRGGLRLSWWDLYLIPFSLVFGGISLTFAAGMFRPGGSVIDLVVSGFFAAVGAYLVFGRFIVDVLVRRNTYYGVSDDRALIVTQFPASRTKSFGLSSLSQVTLFTKSDQSGSISFGPQNLLAEMFAGGTWPGAGALRETRFERIENAKSVYDIIQKAKRDQR